MTHVKLLGELGDNFGTEWQCAGNSVREILKLIDCQVDGFKEYIAECHDKNIAFTIQNGEDFIDADINELGLNNLKDTVIISPVPAGSGKGLGKLLTGLLMLAAMFFMPGMGGMFSATGGLTATGSMSAAGFAATGAGGTLSIAGASAGTVTGLSGAQAMAAGLSVSLTVPGAMVMMLGANLAIAGITEMSAPDAGDMTSDPSFLFNGADNNVEQGQPVPVLYGTMKIGGTPISQGFQTGKLRGANLNYSSGTITGGYYGSSDGTSSGGGWKRGLTIVHQN